MERPYPIPRPSLNPSATRSWCGTSTGVRFRRSPFPSCGRSLRSFFNDSELQQCGSYLLRRVINSGGIRVVLRSLYQDFEMAAAQARHTDNHEHPRIVWPSSPMRKPWILMKQDYRGVAGLCFRSITNTPAPFVSPQRVDPENARQFWLSRESSLSYASLPPRSSL